MQEFRRVPLSAYQTVVVHRGVIVGATWLGSRVVLTPRAWRFLDIYGLWRLRLVQYRYLGRAPRETVRKRQR